MVGCCPFSCISTFMKVSVHGCPLKVDFCRVTFIDFIGIFPLFFL